MIIFVSIEKKMKIGIIFPLVQVLLAKNLIPMFPTFSVGLEKLLGGKFWEKKHFRYIKSGKWKVLLKENKLYSGTTGKGTCDWEMVMLKM